MRGSSTNVKVVSNETEGTINVVETIASWGARDGTIFLVHVIHQAISAIDIIWLFE